MKCDRIYLIHDYFEVDLGEIWKTIQDDLPLLKGQLEPLCTSLGNEAR